MVHDEGHRATQNVEVALGRLVVLSSHAWGLACSRAALQRQAQLQRRLLERQLKAVQKELTRVNETIGGEHVQEEER